MTSGRCVPSREQLLPDRAVSVPRRAARPVMTPCTSPPEPCRSPGSHGSSRPPRSRDRRRARRYQLPMWSGASISACPARGSSKPSSATRSPCSSSPMCSPASTGSTGSLCWCPASSTVPERIPSPDVTFRVGALPAPSAYAVASGGRRGPSRLSWRRRSLSVPAPSRP